MTRLLILFLICVFRIFEYNQSCSAIKLEVTSQYHQDVVPSAFSLRCDPEKIRHCAKKIILIQISKESTKPLATLHGGNSISYGRLMRSSVTAEGRIEEDPEKSFLSVTLSEAMTEDSGIYACKTVFLDDMGDLQQETATVNITVGTQDVQDVVRHLLSKVSLLENIINFQHGAAGERLASLETTLADQGTQLQEQDNQTRHLFQLFQNKQGEFNQLNEKLNGIEEAVARLGDQVKPLRELVQEQKSRLAEHVEKDTFMTAFSYGYDSKDTFNNGEVMVFREPIFRMGDDYNPRTGIFTAPRKGVYVFHLVIKNVVTKGGQLSVYLKAKGQVVALLDTIDSHYHDQSSVSSAVSLDAGDNVYPEVQYLNGANHAHAYNHLTVFTGYLLKTL